MAIGITNAGGGANFWAIVTIDYPSGSTLTATNVAKYKDISATRRIYYVSPPSGSTQTCEFTITDGSHTKTETVSGITVGSARTINLSYEYILLEQNVQYSTSLWTLGNDTLTMQSTGYWRHQRGSGTYSLHIPSIDLSDYSTLYVEYTNSLSPDDNFAIKETNLSTMISYQSLGIHSDINTLTFDVSSINRNVSLFSGISGGRRVDYVKIWLVQ